MAQLKGGTRIYGNANIDGSLLLAGGSTLYNVSISPTSLTGSRTLTLADGNTILQAGTMATTGGTLAQFAATTSAQLAGVISNETGSGSLVFGTSPTITTSLVAGGASFDLINTTATTVNFAGATTTLTIGATTGTTTLRNNVVVSGNLTINGTTTTVNSTVLTIDDPIITLGGDTSVAEVNKDRGIEFKWNGTTLTITNYIGNGTTTVTGTVASTAGFAAGDIITISGATGTEQTKLNGTWQIASVPTGTTFTFVVSTAVVAGTYTTTLGTTVKSKNGFFGLDQSSGRFTFIPQSNQSGEVYSGTTGNIEINDLFGQDIILNGELNLAGTPSDKYIDFFTKNSSLTAFAANLRLVNHDSTSFHTAVRMVRDGAVELYHNNTKAIETTSAGISVPLGTITTGNVAASLFPGNTTTNITIGSGLSTGTLTLGSTTGSGTISIGNTGTAAAQAVNIATATTGTITIGGTGATAVQLPTGKTKVGQTFLLQGGAVNITLPTLAGTLYATGNTDVSLADGGTNASLTAVNGGVVYSTATALAIGAAGTSGQLLVSKGAAAPVFETFELSLHAPHASYKSICRVATTTDLAPSTFASDVLTGYDDTFVLACTTTAGSATVTTTSTAGIKVGASITINASFTSAVTVTVINSATTFTVSSGVGVVAGTNVNTTFTQTIAALVIDGVTLAVNNRVLVKDSYILGGLPVLDAAKYNGIYRVTATGSTTVPWTLTRTDDANVAIDLDGAIVNISEGTLNYGKSYKTRFKGTDVLNTTEMYWGRIVDVNSCSYGILPATKVGIDLSSDTETIRFKTGTIADLVAGLSLGIKTIQAFAASTYTNASTLYIEGAPVASTNATITNAYALQVAAGNTFLGGNLIVANVDSSGTAALNIGTGASAKTITIGNGTGATSVVLNCGTGALNIGTNAIARTITIGNTTGASSVVINAGTGGVSLPSGTTKVGTSTLTQGSATARTITFPDATTTLVGTDATQTLSNKTYLIPYTQGAGTALTATLETTNQVLFPAAGDTITLAAGVYDFNMLVAVTRGATSITSSALRINILGAGTAVGTFSGSAIGPAFTGFFTGALISSNHTVTGTSAVAGATYLTRVTGIIKITTAGTIIPAYGLTVNLANASTTTTCNAANYMILLPISASGTTTAQGGWA